MRTIAFLGAAAVAASLLASGGAWAWSQEQPASSDGSSALFTDPDSFKALEDKVNGKGETKSGFYFSGGVNSGDSGLSGANPYRLPPLQSGSAFSYSPMPGFRGQPQ
jgi:hypothetical protein